MPTQSCLRVVNKSANQEPVKPKKPVCGRSRKLFLQVEWAP